MFLYICLYKLPLATSYLGITIYGKYAAMLSSTYDQLPSWFFLYLYAAISAHYYYYIN